MRLSVAKNLAEQWTEMVPLEAFYKSRKGLKLFWGGLKPKLSKGQISSKKSFSQ